MDEIIKSTDNRYSEYETLLFLRDKLRKEAYAWKNRYLAEFGNLITAVFEQKIACIKKKKTISFCQMAVNRGKPVDQAELQNYLSQEMKEYNRKLSEMIQENEIAHSGETISEETAAKIKKLYRRLAKQIHPDMNPKTNEIPELKELWQRIVVSYRANDLEELEEAEVLVNKFLADHHLDENEIIRIYGKRWDIDVFFKVCKSYLNLSKECNSLSYDAMTAHTAVVFTRYMMLSLESRESNDNRSLRELFLYFSDEMSDITWIQAFQMLLQMFRTMLLDNTELSDEKINEIQQQKGGLSK